VRESVTDRSPKGAIPRENACGLRVQGLDPRSVDINFQEGCKTEHQNSKEFKSRSARGSSTDRSPEGAIPNENACGLRDQDLEFGKCIQTCRLSISGFGLVRCQ